MRIVYAARYVQWVTDGFHTADTASVAWWLADLCGGGTWSRASRDVVTFPTKQALLDALVAAEVPLDDGYPVEIVEVVEVQQ